MGCGGPRFDGSVYRGDGFAFRVPPLAPGWERVEQTHAALTFRDRANRASILVNGRCGLDGDDVPLGALTNHLFLQFTERDIETQEVVPFDGREAMHTRMSAKLDGVPLRYRFAAFDVLYVDGQDLTGLPFRERRRHFRRGHQPPAALAIAAA